MTESWYKRLERYGQAAAATTTPGQTPRYGLVYDLTSGQWINAEQFQQFVRDIMPVTQQAALSQAEMAKVKSLREDELERARNYQGGNLASRDDDSLFEKTGQFFKQHVFDDILPGTQNPDAEDLTEDAYAQYIKKGGLLSEDEFNEFDERTRAWLVSKASTSKWLKETAGKPGISQALTGLNYGYRGISTPFHMISESSSQNPEGIPFNLSNVLDMKMWFSQDEWASAWRETQDKSLGNALMDSLLNPYVEEDTLDRWRKENSLYQFSSFGSEFAVAWYADPGVIAGKGLGNAQRIARNELPLNENSATFKAVTQNLQGERITVRNPVTRKYADWRAERIRDGWEGVEAYAKAVEFPEFANLPMFRRRAVAGGPGAYALHWAFNHGSPEIVDLSRRMLHGDPKAYAQLAELKKDPKRLEKFAPGSQSFIDAVEATKTKVTQLDQEVADLEKAQIKSPFHNWSVHAELDAKQTQITEATDALKGYEGYGAWLELLGTKAGDRALPLVAQVKAPSKPKWSSQTERRNSGTRRFFMDNQFGFAHTVHEIPRSTWIKKANTISMHDLDSGIMSINRQFDQFEHLFGYLDPDARTAALDSWHRAETNMDRYKVVYELEETHLIQAAADHFGLSNNLIRSIYEKINDERNQTIRGVMSGSGQVYSSAPSLGKRIDNPNDHSVSLVSQSEDGSTVQLQIMDGRQHKQTITVPAEAVVERVRPVDVTQTPNYYNPIDTRRFYLELKRNRELLEALDKGGFANAKAGLAELTDVVGTTFNAFWKPAQLWRFGWPQRVLMDEGMRAASIFGPMYWLTGAGSEAVQTAGRNIAPFISRKFNERRNGQVPLGAGPVTRRQQRETNPFVRDQEVAESVQVPEMFLGKSNPSRLAAVEKAAADFAAWKRTHDRRQAWMRTNETGPLGPLEQMPDHPMSRVFYGWQRQANDAKVSAPMAYDATSGLRSKKGFVIPIPDQGKMFDAVNASTDPTALHNLLYWYEKNAELLSKAGYRIVMDPSGTVQIGRWFNSAQRKQANEFLKYVNDTHKGAQLWDLQRGISTKVSDEGFGYVDHDGSFVALSGDEYGHLWDEAHAEDVTRADDAAAAGELRAQETAVDDFDFDLFDSELNNPTTRRWNRITEHKSFGTGYVTYTSSDGKQVRVDNAFEGHAGSIFKALTSSNKTIDILSEGHGGALALMRQQAQGHRTFHPPKDPATLKKGSREYKQAVLYYQRWADMVNDQIGNSPIWSKMLKGWSDDKIVHWLENTSEGAALRREMMRDHAEPALWVNEHRAKLDYYLPSDKLQRLLGKGRLEPSDLRRNVHDEDLPDIFGPDIEVLDKRRRPGRALSDAADKIWNALGTVPIDTLSRHPFAKAVYDAKLRSLINSTDSKWLDDATVSRMQEQARVFSMNQVRKTLWDLTDETNFTDALRFIAPFWGAQQEAILKWLRIISDRPETVARFFVGQRAAYNNFVVIDEEGNEVNKGTRKGGLHDLGLYHPTDRVILRVPEFMRKGPLGKSLEAIGAVGIPLGSANTVLQGELPLMPGPGPLLTIPADKFLRAYSDTYGTENDEDFLYRWLFPVGRPRSGGIGGILEQVSPGWGKRVMSAFSDEDDMARANLHFQVGREMIAEAQRTGKPKPSDDEIKNAANWLWALRAVAGITLPVQTQFRPKNQYYIDMAHKYQREYGAEYWDKFVEDFGLEMAIYATSSSSGIVAPTSEGMGGWRKNQKLVAEFPDWASVIGDPDAFSDEFSWDAYVAQFDINLGPGDTQTLRELKDARERFADNDVRTGWHEFRKFQSMVDAELYARGLTNIQQNEAQDLLQLKRAFLADLTQRNPTWRKQYDDFGSDIYARVNELSQFAFDKRFDKRPDMLGVRQYLLIRDQVASELDRYAAQEGGSRSLQAQENGDLRAWFYNEVGLLVQSNPAFGEFYARYLDSDTLEQGGGGW